ICPPQKAWRQKVSIHQPARSLHQTVHTSPRRHAMSTTPLKLFTPVTFGPLHLKHRVVMAPLTRSRSDQPDNIPGDLMAEYYSQRASDGGLIIGEATNISFLSRGWQGAPGLFTDQQVEGWKKVLAAVH